MNFPERPPSPTDLSSVDVSTIDERIHLEQSNWIFEHDSKEYTYDYSKDKWIPRKRQLDELEDDNDNDNDNDDDDDDEQVNKSHIKKARTEQMSKLKQKLSELKQKKTTTTAAFISNLPVTITSQEIADLFSKYGSIALDKQGNPRVKLYTATNTHEFNGQALVIYNKPESVTMAIDMMDGTTVKDTTIKVEPATFSEKPKKDYSNEIESIKQKLKSRHPAVVILTGMFRKSDYDETLQQDIILDINDECAKLDINNDDIHSIQFMPETEEIHIKFTKQQLAEICIQCFNDRWYDGLKVAASLQQ
ncbi:uncharacterized protein SPAPADRAFT_143429 [Spathaspora passalidarum NRRL Y-27907]|uniref:RRM domain-containing protein n=1 Tax=Spathaspora passalidarum (strain NRRL Y-27907 / 11-Y1) TaxID=619300 RepID=G3AUK7_SPAPN|nr:uncharacterized protein SPAPADRAFT_143429 [Spathaspora passalidarum NRRL Y-27907]EGW30563.1 hypothetical protein SPAPADRAFT_143429 [Spathaspora passalidarum NRRL Y-27907]